DQVIDADLPVGEALQPVASTEAVSLLTIHSAKGLEFPVVFLVNLRPPRPRDTERLFFDPDGLGFVMKTWRGEKHPRFQLTSPGAPAVALAIGERRRVVYVGLTRAKDELFVTATREEQSSAEVEIGDHDHFPEILSWALANPAKASVVEADQLQLLSLYTGPDAGRPMIERYREHPLASVSTLGVEVQFNLRLGGARIRGVVDRVCEVDGRTVLIDYKTNTTLDDSLIAAYSLQLRLY